MYEGRSRKKTALTLIVDINLPAVGLSHTAADALHAGLDHLLHLRGEGARGADDLYIVGDDVVAVAAVDETASHHATVQGVLIINKQVNQIQYDALLYVFGKTECLLCSWTRWSAGL